MVRSLHILTIAMFLLATGVWAFVQDPVPPSSQQNFFVDEDEDGRMDHLQIRFLGVISQDYIDAKMDSLAVNWVDSLGHALRIVVPKKDFILDTVSNRRIIIDLSDRQSSFYRLTALATRDFFIAPYGACMLFLSDGSVYTLNMKDGMAPSIVSCQLKSHRSRGVDSLKISFSEKVKTSHSCDEYLERSPSAVWISARSKRRGCVRISAWFCRSRICSQEHCQKTSALPDSPPI